MLQYIGFTVDKAAGFGPFRGENLNLRNPSDGGIVAGFIGFFHTVFNFCQCVVIIFRKICPSVHPSIFITEGDLSDASDCSVRIGDSEVSLNVVTAVILGVLPLFDDLHRCGIDDGFRCVGNDNVHHLCGFVYAYTVNGVTHRRPVAFGICYHIHVVGGLTVLVDGQPDHTLRNAVACFFGRSGFLYVVGAAGAQTP